MAVQNGRLATATLTAIPARYYTYGAGAFLRADAAAAFLRVAAAFEARFGKPLTCISFYRTYQRQVEIFQERYTVRSGASSKVKATDRKWNGVVYKLKAGYAPSAVPGISNHGLGQAVDFNAGVQTAGSKENAWFKANAPAYGWDWTEGKRNGEPWHWTYDAAQDRYRNNPTSAAVAAAGQTATKVAEEVDDMFNDADRGALKALYDTQKRHTQQIDAIEKTLNAADGRGKQAFDRILGILPQRYAADKSPRRVLDTGDGDTLRGDIANAVKTIVAAVKK